MTGAREPATVAPAAGSSPVRRPDRIWLMRLSASILLLALVLRTVDLPTLWETIKSADARLLLVNVMLFFPGQLWAAFRWGFVLDRLGCPLPFRSALRYTMLGQFSSLFLPGQVSGDVVRVIAVTRGRERKGSYALAVLVDRLATLCAIFIVVVLGGASSEQLSDLPLLQPTAVALFLATFLLLILAGQYRSARLPDIVAKILSRLNAGPPWLSDLAEWPNLPRLSLASVLLSLAMALVLQVAQAAGSYVLARSLNVLVAFTDWAAVNAAASLVQALPVTIAGLGARDGVYVAMLELFGVPRARSAAVSLLGFVIVATLTALGWFALDSTHREARGPSDDEPTPGDRGEWFEDLTGGRRPSQEADLPARASSVSR